MKKVEAYKCDHCPKTSTNPSALFQHERRCKKNPNNKHKCFDFCKHLVLEINSDTMFKQFKCGVTNGYMYSYKREYRGLRLYGERMPLECDKFEHMNLEQVMDNPLKTILYPWD